MAFERFKKAWNVFRGRDPTLNYTPEDYYYGSSYRPDQAYYSFTSKQSIVTTIYNRIAVDVAAIDIKHVRLKTGDDAGDRQYQETISSDLNYALTLSPNIDQTAKALIKETVLTMFDKGCVAWVPITTDVNPETTESYNVQQIRCGRVIEWYPYKVKIDLYREEYGRHEEIILDKRIVPIFYNPFYEIMNEPNSTLQRLLRTISQLEKFNHESASGKLDMIIQLPYKIRSDAMRKQADERKRSIEEQLNGSKYGIAYADATEKIIQLNRPLENNLWQQVMDLQSDLFNQLGLTQTILDGTADENTRLNYYNNTIEPILSVITEETERKWLTKTARTQGQAIMYFRNPFKLIPVNEVAKNADTLTRNEIMTSNEFRSVLGLKPVSDPKADELRNSNLNHPPEEGVTEETVDMNELTKQINIPIPEE